MIAHSKPWLTNEDQSALRDVLASEFIAQGQRTANFEKELSDWVGASGGVAVSSGAAALHLALSACPGGSRDEVILPTYVCRHLLEAIQTAAAVPVFCDVGTSWLVEPENVAPLITNRTRALFLPHLYGMFVDIESFRCFGVPIIEDCAQAVGTRKSGAISGDIAVFSFHPTKCLTTGEGGMAISKDGDLLERMRSLRDGSSEISRRVFSPLSDLAAALGSSQLSRYDVALQRRHSQAGAYAKALSGSVADFQWYGRKRSMFFRFPVRFSRGFQEAEILMKAHGVTVRRGVDELLHRIYGLPDAGFTNAVRHFRETVSLPIYPALTDDELERCLSACSASFARIH